jgi:hypothetical protein
MAIQMQVLSALLHEIRPRIQLTRGGEKKNFKALWSIGSLYRELHPRRRLGSNAYFGF